MAQPPSPRRCGSRPARSPSRSCPPSSRRAPRSGSCWTGHPRPGRRGQRPGRVRQDAAAGGLGARGRGDPRPPGSRSTRTTTTRGGCGRRVAVRAAGPPVAGRDAACGSVAGHGRRCRGGADLVEALADALDTSSRRCGVVLDDVHELTGREVLRDLTRLIRRSPAGLASSSSPAGSDPPISVPRLRLEGRLHEVRADALRFTRGRRRRAAARPPASTLTPAQVAVLHARTEGWAAGLRLAALALRRTDDPSAFLTELLRGRALGRRVPDRARSSTA